MSENVVFEQHLKSRLYIFDQKDFPYRWAGFLLPDDVEPAEPEIDLARALTDRDLSGTFIFSMRVPDIESDEGVASFVKKIYGVIEESIGDRGVMWLSDIDDIGESTTSLMLFDGGGTRVIASCSIPLVEGDLDLVISSGSNVSLNEEKNSILLKRNSGAVVSFSGPSKPDVRTTMSAMIPLTGGNSSCALFDISIERSSLNNDLRWGMEFASDSSQNFLRLFFPLASSTEGTQTDYIQFNGKINPSDLYNLQRNEESVFYFAGKDLGGEDTVLSSWYRTASGQPVSLYPFTAVPDGGEGEPAGLVIQSWNVEGESDPFFHFSPVGDFVLSVDEPEHGEFCDLICGLSGTETVRFKPKTKEYEGDRIRFFEGRGAVAHSFPLPEISPVGPPIDRNSTGLGEKYCTSWASVIAPPSTGNRPYYTSQPDGFQLFGIDNLVYPVNRDLLGYIPAGIQMPDLPQLSYPLAPFSNVNTGDGKTFMDSDQAVLFEQQYLIPARKKAITAAGFYMENSTEIALNEENFVSETDKETVTTPSGMLVNIDSASGKWKSVLLAENQETGEQFSFLDPDMTLRQALQSNRLFMVATSPKHLGSFINRDSVGQEEDNPAFRNIISIDGWQFSANVGAENSYDDYRNVLIFKFCRGTLKDLANNPQLWTQATEFNMPENSTDTSQLTAVSFWLRKYIEESIEKAKKEKSLERFAQIAQSESWNGVLCLRVDISKLPEQLAGLTAGMDRRRFCAHHIGIEMNPVTIEQIRNNGKDGKTSTLFGLIDYEDAAYDPAKGANAVAPEEGAIYDFKVLELKVLFENSAIKSFKSVAQLTMNRMFALPVSHMGEGGNSYNSVVLKGSCQHKDGRTIYMLDAGKSNDFYFDSHVINKVEITKVQFGTLNDGGEALNGEDKPVTAQFSLWGFIDFKVTEAVDGDEKYGFDIFSFGNRKGEDHKGVGLRFSGLKIFMSGATTPEGDPLNSFLLNSEGIRFDVTRSTVRKHSLFENFSLELEHFQEGGGKKTPNELDFLPVVSDLRVGSLENEWNGIVFRVTMGTPGELAGKINLDSHLLLAWSDGQGAGAASYPVFTGIKLPGTGGGAELISLQGVLKLSIGDIWLRYVKEQNSFLLLLSDIALKFLGIKKLPPNGSIAFYLFGNPDPDKNDGELGWYAAYNQKMADQIEGRIEK